MTKIDIEAIAREAGFLITVLEPRGGYEPIRMIQPVSSTNIGVELQRFAALLLEKAAQVCDVTPPEPFRPSIEAAHAIRQMAAGMGE